MHPRSLFKAPARAYSVELQWERLNLCLGFLSNQQLGAHLCSEVLHSRLPHCSDNLQRLLHKWVLAHSEYLLQVVDSLEPLLSNHSQLFSQVGSSPQCLESPPNLKEDYSASNSPLPHNSSNNFLAGTRCGVSRPNRLQRLFFVSSSNISRLHSSPLLSNFLSS